MLLQPDGASFLSIVDISLEVKDWYESEVFPGSGLLRMVPNRQDLLRLRFPLTLSSS